MGWFRPSPPPPPPRPVQTFQMRRMTPAEIWTDDHGIVAILNASGSYALYINPESVTYELGSIADQPKIRARLNQALLSIINAKTTN